MPCIAVGGLTAMHRGTTTELHTTILVRARTCDLLASAAPLLERVRAAARQRALGDRADGPGCGVRGC